MTNRVIDDNGYMTIKNNPVSRAGVFQYLAKSVDPDHPSPNQLVNVYRPAEELQKPECLDSFKTLPIIDDHAMLGDGKNGTVAPEKKVTHGITGEGVDFRGDVLYSDIKIFSNGLQKSIQSGKRGLSLGYRCNYEKRSGSFAGKSYDYVQRDLRGNHLALVDRPRNDVYVLDESTPSMTFDHLDLSITEKETTMPVDKEALDAALKPVMDAMDALTKRLDAKDEAEKKIEAEEKAALDKKAKDEEANKDKDKDKDIETKVEDGKKAMDAMDVALKDTQKALKDTQDALETVKKDGMKSLLKEMSQRTDLAAKVTPLVGTFDASEMTVHEVAKYAVDKLKLTCDSGHEVSAINAYLAARITQGGGKSVSFDSKDAPKSGAMDEALKQSNEVA